MARWPPEPRPNAHWSVDFVHDQLWDGRCIRILDVIDGVIKECLAAVADTSIPGRRPLASSKPSSLGATRRT
jgi:hypothetical protein